VRDEGRPAEETCSNGNSKPFLVASREHPDYSLTTSESSIHKHPQATAAATGVLPFGLVL